MKKLLIIALLWSIPAYTGEGAGEAATRAAETARAAEQALEEARVKQEDANKKLENERKNETTAEGKVTQAMDAVSNAKTQAQHDAAQAQLKAAQEALQQASDKVNNAQEVLATVSTELSDAQTVAIKAQADLSKVTLPGTSGMEIETPFTNATDSLSAINTAQMDPSVVTAITTLLPAIKSQSDTFANLQDQAQALAKSGENVGMRKLQDQMADLIVEISKNSSLTQKNATLDAITKDLLDTVVASFNTEIEKLGQRAVQFDSLMEEKMSWFDKLTYNFGKLVSGTWGNVDLAASEAIGFKPYDFEKQPIADYVDAAKQIVAEKATNPDAYDTLQNEVAAFQGLAGCFLGNLDDRDIQDSFLNSPAQLTAKKIFNAASGASASPIVSFPHFAETLNHPENFVTSLFDFYNPETERTLENFTELYKSWNDRIEKILPRPFYDLLSNPTSTEAKDLQLLVMLNRGWGNKNHRTLNFEQSGLLRTPETRALLWAGFLGESNGTIPVDQTGAQQLLDALKTAGVSIPTYS